MRNVYNGIILEIERQEEKLAAKVLPIMEEAYQMTIFLQDALAKLKRDVLKDGFENEHYEMKFFRNIKPQILGKLIYYNKVFQVETGCPVRNGKMFIQYFARRLKELKNEFRQSICNTDFYKYYRSGRTDRDELYFKLGKINLKDGLNSDVFEIDLSFSTYYDHKVAHIISNELLYSYLLSKISPEENPETILKHIEDAKDIAWTGSKNALIELIYAFHASGMISNGKIGIRKLGTIFQVLFRTPLGDLHHAFHRMKVRSGSRTAFIDQLKLSLEDYMDKNI